MWTRFDPIFDFEKLDEEVCKFASNLFEMELQMITQLLLIVIDLIRLAGWFLMCFVCFLLRFVRSFISREDLVPAS